MKKQYKTKDWILTILFLLVTSLYPIIVLYTRNLELVKFQELYFPSALFLSVNVLIFAAALLFTRSLEHATIFGMILFLLFTNYRYVEIVFQKIFPRLKVWHILIIFLFILIHLFWFLTKKIPIQAFTPVRNVILIAVCALALFNIVPALPHMIAGSASTPDVRSDIDVSKDRTGSNIPNVYLLLFDEYSGFEAIENVYKYKNTKLERYLLDRGFSISYDSRNESIATATVVNNFLNLEYVVDDSMSVAEIEALSNPPMLYQIFREHSCELKGIGTTEKFYLPSSEAAKDFTAATMEGETFQTLLLRNTVLYFTVQNRMHSDLASEHLTVFRYMESADAIPTYPTFTFLYMVLPHQPFLFNEYGNPLNSYQHNNWSDKSIYLGQYKYTTTKMMDIIDNLLLHDPDSVILLQSDHAARAVTDSNISFEYTDMTNNLNCVYYRGMDSSKLIGSSSINTIRLVLNELFSMDMLQLEASNNES